MTTITTPDAVPNQLIFASWGDKVRADLNHLNDDKLSRLVVKDTNGNVVQSQNTMQTMLFLPSTNPTNVNHAVRLGYANATYLQVDGGNNMTKDLNMGGHHVVNMGDPEGPGNAVTLSYANTWYLNKTGDTMTAGVLTLSPDAENATGARAAMPRSWIMDQVQTRLPLGGGTITGNLTVNGTTNIGNTLNMSSSRIIGLADPVNPQDAATRKWCLDTFQAK